MQLIQGIKDIWWQHAEWIVIQRQCADFTKISEGVSWKSTDVIKEQIECLQRAVYCVKYSRIESKKKKLEEIVLEVLL